MTCQFCGHNTRGPWPYCDETCEMDHGFELEAQRSPDDDVGHATGDDAEYVDAYAIDLDM